jgi:hypothetical protein
MELRRCTEAEVEVKLVFDGTVLRGDGALGLLSWVTFYHRAIERLWVYESIISDKVRCSLL